MDDISTKAQMFRTMAKEAKDRYGANHAEISKAIFTPAPLRKGVSENMMKRIGSPCDDGYAEELKRLLEYLNEQA